MDKSFREFLDNYFSIWKSSSITELTEIIFEDYQGREVSGDEMIDFGYEESLEGWEQGFSFVNENDAEWKLNEISVFPLRDGEMMVILSATMIIHEISLKKGNLFFQTFKKIDDEWKLIRSYIEAGVSVENVPQWIAAQTVNGGL